MFLPLFLKQISKERNNQNRSIDNQKLLLKKSRQMIELCDTNGSCQESLHTKKKAIETKIILFCMFISTKKYYHPNKLKTRCSIHNPFTNTLASIYFLNVY